MIALLQTNWPVLAVLGGIAVLSLLLRNRATPVDALDEIVAHGQPAVVEIYINT